jgi:hypothetical protein
MSIRQKHESDSSSITIPYHVYYAFLFWGAENLYTPQNRDIDYFHHQNIFPHSVYGTVKGIHKRRIKDITKKGEYKIKDVNKE